jgi:endoglucanase
MVWLALVLATTQAAPSFAAGACSAMTLPGANVAGGEFNGGKRPAVYARDYIYPAAGEIALLQRLGLKMMRVPFLWERVQPKLLGPLDIAEIKRLDDVVQLAAAAGLTVVLDVHNYGTYAGISLDRPAVPRRALPDLWKRLAQHYGGDANVVFGLMNEPKDIDTETWAGIAADTLAAIRFTAAPNIVLIPGTHWDGAHSWQNGAPHSNADVLLPLAQSDSRVVFEVHQYFDDDFSGTGPTCGAAAQVPLVLARIGVWARVHHVRLMLGEFGVSQKPECVKALDDALAVVETDHEVWYGWTYWAAGAWWGDYPFNIETANGDTPQGKVLHARADALARTACDRDR